MIIDENLRINLGVKEWVAVVGIIVAAGCWVTWVTNNVKVIPEINRKIDQLISETPRKSSGDDMRSYYYPQSRLMQTSSSPSVSMTNFHKE